MCSIFKKPDTPSYTPAPTAPTPVVAKPESVDRELSAEKKKKKGFSTTATGDTLLAETGKTKLG